MKESYEILSNETPASEDVNYNIEINNSFCNPSYQYLNQNNSFPDLHTLYSLMFPSENSNDDTQINPTIYYQISPNNEELEQTDKSYKKLISLDENEERQNNVDDITNRFFSLREIKEEIIPLLNSYIFETKIIKNEEIIKKIENNKKLNEIHNNISYGCGRKTLGDKSERNHNNYSYDNVMRKIKGKIFNNIKSFVNQVIDLYIDEKQKKNLRNAIRTKTRRENEDEDLLKILDYSITKKLTKIYNLNLLQMSLKEFLSQNISPSFHSLRPDSNKIIIDLLSNEINNEIINSVLELKVEEYLDFYTYKNEIDIIKKIENEKKVNFKRSDVLLNEIILYDDLYFTIYIFHLFNFKWWFETKTEKNTSKKK